MRRHFRRLIALPALLLPLLAQAGVRLVVDGVNDPLKGAVTSAVDLSQYATSEVSAAQLRRLVERAPAQVSATLRPYGYYEATARGELKQTGPHDWQVTVHVQPGVPVKVTSVQLDLDPAVAALASIRRAKRAIEKLQGQVLNDSSYEAARDAMSAALTANGYLGAQLKTHRVAVNRGQHSAAVQLAWHTGPRYRFGQVHFEGSQFREGFLERYVPFKRGEYFVQNDLLLLQEALTGADYFSVVNVLPDVHDAQGGVVDVNVQLVPAKRSIYTGGPFVGTD
ncbi:MAG: autotransporter assembly complex family protein, partial [Steroidobacterales bacterium]